MAAVTGESVRFTHDHDLVPSLPPTAFGYHHVAREVWETPSADESGAVTLQFQVCDGSGEDPTCHASICYLGYCSYSIADHMLYLGKHMYHNALEC